MAKSLKYILLFYTCIFTTLISFSQNWTKQSINKKSGKIQSVYRWEEHDDYHSSGGEIILTTNGRFKYSAHYPLNINENSDGTFLLKNDTLVLNSDYQSDNLKVFLNYIDTITLDTTYIRLSFPKNQKGDILYNGYYFLNNDTTLNSRFDPMVPYNKNILSSIKNLRVEFYDNHVGSTWIPVISKDGFIQVEVLTDNNLNDYQPKILNDWKFKIVGNKLIDLSEKKY